MPNSLQTSLQHVLYAAIAKGNGTTLPMRCLSCSTRTRISRRRSVGASELSKQLHDSNGISLLGMMAHITGLELGGLWGTGTSEVDIPKLKLKGFLGVGRSHCPHRIPSWQLPRSL